MAEDEQEKSQEATPRRREEARKKGQVARSRELSSAALILGATWGIGAMAPMLVTKVREFMVYGLSSLTSVPLTPEELHHMMLFAMFRLGVVLLPILILTSAIGIMSAVGQHGLLWTTEPLVPDWSRLDPTKGIKKLFSSQSLAELAKTLMKFSLIGFVAYLIVRQELATIVMSLSAEPQQVLATLRVIVGRLGLWTGLAIAVLGALDFAFQRWDYAKKLRMSRQELKDEMRHTEGDPIVRGRIRSLQREMARKRMMADVPKADVVITNPAELAVALMYRQGTMKAPKVVAKGSGFLAKRIREIAKEHHVPLVENKPLARALFRAVEIGQMVPSELYRAVAEILAYVYRLRKGQGTGKG